MDDPNAPSLWLILGLGMGLMGSFIMLLWLNHKWATRRRPKSDASQVEARRTPQALRRRAPVVSREIHEAAPSLITQAARFIMSRSAAQDDGQNRPATPLPDQGREPGQRVAMPGNGVNVLLPGNVLPEEVREVMRFWAMVESAERVIAGGKIGQAEAVELIFNCKRSGRPESVYARAVAAIKARSEAAYRERQAQLVELQAAAAAAQDD